jgi:hypothetical protein
LRLKSDPDSEGCDGRTLMAIALVLVVILVGIGYWLVNR